MKIKFNQGFTLIELLVVLMIMGTISAIAVLSLPNTDSDKLAEKESKRLYQLLKVASDDATLTNNQYGISFTNQGYDFYKLSDARTWQKVAQHRFLKSHFYAVELDAQIRINDIIIEIDEFDSLKLELDDEKQIKPQIMMLSDGEMIPDFEIRYTNPKTSTEFIIKPGNLTLLQYQKKTLDDF